MTALSAKTLKFDPRCMKTLSWYHMTRAIGALTLLYGVLIDDSAQRGEIILGGFGLLGLEGVARSEPAK